jgi:alpha-ketoglutarate-dependent taurine dioxygenase
MTAHAANLAAAQELFEITPLQPSLGAEIGGIDLAGPLEPAARDALRAALLAYKVLFFRDQDLSHEEHIAFTANFGALGGLGAARADRAPDRRRHRLRQHRQGL